MLTLFYKSTEDKDCDCSIIKYIDRIWLQPPKEEAEVLRFFVLEVAERSVPIQRLHMLIPHNVAGHPEDLCFTCDLDEKTYYWNKAAGGNYAVTKHLNKNQGTSASGEFSEDGIDHIKFFATCDQEIRNEPGFSILDITLPEPIKQGERVEIRTRFRVQNAVTNRYAHLNLNPLYQIQFSYFEPETFEKFKHSMADLFDASAIILPREIPAWTLYKDKDILRSGGFDTWVNLPAGYEIGDKPGNDGTKASDHDIDGKLVAISGEKIVWRGRTEYGHHQRIALGNGWKISAQFGPAINISEELTKLEERVKDKIRGVELQQERQRGEIADLTTNTQTLVREMKSLVWVERIALILASLGVLLAAVGIFFPEVRSFVRPP